MKVAIIAAMRSELGMLLSKLERPRVSRIARFSFHQGKLEGHQVILLFSGIGKVNAAIATSLLIDRYEPEAVLNTGVAGGFDKDLETGDIVISTEVCHHDVDATPFGHEIGQVPQMPHFYSADSGLLTKAQAIISSNLGYAVKSGLIVSGDVFVEGIQIAEKILHNFPKALAAEMEGAAIAQTCYTLDTPFLIIRSISDIIGRGANSLESENFLLLAANNSANFVCRLLESTMELK